MKTSKILFCCLFLFIFSNQNTLAQDAFNLNLEEISPVKQIPKKWYGAFNKANNEHSASLDTIIKKQGNYAVKIKAPEGDNIKAFGACFTVIPAKYAGKNITLSGYIKTEKVKSGYAGLWMRQDGESSMLEFDNMSNRGITGDKDWTLCKITLSLHPEAKKINVGALLVGDGTMWFDELNVSIDDKDISEALPKKEKIYGADADKEFDLDSKITINQLSATQIEELSILGKIWGFLKYHHPSIAQGKYNWDYQLFRVFPQIIQAQNKKERSEIYLAWINTLGEIPPCPTCKNPDKKDLASTVNLSWLQDEKIFSEALIQKLNYLLENRNQDENYYIGMAPNIGNPIFKHENPYADFETPDAGYRLLALFRYWNAIQYFFPYKDVIDGTWEKVLPEFLPKFVQAQDALSYRLTALELIARISDTHANIWGRDKILEQYKGDKFAAVQIKFIEDKAVVTNYYHQELAKESGLQKGDILTKVNGLKIEDIIKAKIKYTPASNYPTQLRDIAKDLLRSSEDKINIEFLRDQQTIASTLNCYNRKDLNLYMDYTGDKTAKSYQLIQPDIGYVFLGRIKGKDILEMMELFKNTKGLIIDIRNYPSEFVVFSLTKYLLPEAKEFVKFTAGDITNPGMFKWTATMLVGEENPAYYKGKIAILVNEISQSQAEYTSMALRTAPKAKVIGSTTAGADGNVSTIFLPGNIRTMISGIGVFYPDGTATQRIGIVADIECKPTIQGIKAGKDEVLEKAIEYIQSKE